jgi:hypothetical protein
MFKIFGRILLVILIVALFSIGVYYLLNSGTSQSQAPFRGETPPSLNSENNQQNRQGVSETGGSRQEKIDSTFLGAAWLDLLKNLLVISAFTIVVVLIQKILTQKGQMEKTREII